MKQHIGEDHKLSLSTGKFLYGLFSALIAPLIMVYWAAILHRTIHWSVPQHPAIGFIVSFVGAMLLITGITDIIIYGHGLPMNAYPPQHYVTKGIYAWFRHPIYVGATLFSGGMALLFRYGSGLYIVTPVVALIWAAIVFGYEHRAMQKQFGVAMQNHHPLFALPANEQADSTWMKRVAMVIRLFVPYIFIGYLIDYARFPASGLFLHLFDWTLVQNGGNVAWLIPFLYMLAQLLLAQTDAELFDRVIAGTLATGFSLYLYLVLPPLGITITNSGGILVINTLLTLLAIKYRIIWSTLKNLVERVANSRHDWLFAGGRFRIINHSIYAGLGGAVGVAIMAYLLGNNVAVLLLLLSALIGAALFAQLWWGSSALLRPFGYWGAVLGGIVGAGCVHFIFNIPLATLAMAGVLSAPLVQAIGRLRCLVQGCCHGTPTHPHVGIRVWQPQSRVCALSGLTGEAIHPTQLYSIAFNLLLAPLVWALWSVQSIPSSIIVGMYLVLTGLERFAEDAYRGETQTKTIRELKESQWVAIVGLLVGLGITMLPSGLPTGAVGQVDLPLILTAIIGGLISAFAMGMDFPKSSVRFSRLSG
jgi:protein-S-isoprenylcysteine O-methyltransferase Ste14